MMIVFYDSIIAKVLSFRLTLLEQFGMFFLFLFFWLFLCLALKQYFFGF